MLSKQGYSIKDISIFSAIGMGIAFPSPYFVGWLTKKYAPFNLILIIFILTGIAVIILLFPISVPLYLTGMAFIGILPFSLCPVVMSLIFDWFDEKTLPMAQSYLGIGAWLAAIVGYLFTGMLLQRTGQTNTIFVGILILIVASTILIFGVKKKASVAY
jgi:MFS family permease